MTLKSILHGILLCSVVIFTACLCSCTQNSFRISGLVKDGKDSTLYLERGMNGRWVTLDSAKINSGGDFKISYEAPGTPDIYRLRMGERYIYFPIDSLDNVSVETSLTGFGSDFKLSGTKQAEQFSAFEKDASRYATITDDAKLAQFKKEIFNKYIKDDRAGLLSYYILTKVVNGKLFFNPEDQFDSRMYVAVATAYKQYKPNDPRTAMLEQAALDIHRAERERRGTQRVIQANTTALLEIELKDYNGKIQKLSALTSNGKPTVIVFNTLTAETSPEINRALSKIYNSGSVNIYQIGFDNDELAWRQAAQNLPWTVVYEPKGGASRYLSDYNVTELPTFFICNRAGEIVDRATSIQELNQKTKQQ